MMNKVCALGYVAIALSGTSAMADNICSRYVSSPAVVFVAEPPQRIYHSVTVDQIEKYSGAREPSSEASNMTLGMTIHSEKLHYDIGYSIAQVPDGFCVSPQVKVTLTDRHIDVLLPKELPVDSCLYQAVLNHENKHAAVLEGGMESAMREEAGSIQSGIGTAYGFVQSLAKAQPWLARFKETVPLRFQTVAEQVDSQSRALDTPEENARLSSVCRDSLEAPPPKKGFFERIFGGSED